MIGLVNRANTIQAEISDVFNDAYTALEYANITMGSGSMSEIASSIPEEKEYEVLTRSVMGVEIPLVRFEEEKLEASYGFFRSNASLDVAVSSFEKVKYMIYELAEIETSVYKLAMEIKKTQKRANALDKISIPKYEEITKSIENALEEKEREDFFRLKKVKDKVR